MDRYIGLDVHASSCTAAVINSRGKKIASQVIETNGDALVEFFKIQPGRLHLCLEEGTQSTWLTEILTPHVEELVVTMPPERRGSKSDAIDALALADQLRRGSIELKVYKHQGPFGTLRQLVKTHVAVVDDTRRVQNRLKALYRSRGVLTPGKEVYDKVLRLGWLEQLPRSNQGSAEILYDQYDALCAIRQQAKKDLVRESHRFGITKVLETCPGLGEIRVARLVATVISPQRFRSRQKFWAYCGLAIEMRSSSDWDQRPDGAWQRVERQVTRGLNKGFNRMLKDVFKGAATTVIQQGGEEPLRLEYLRQLQGGTKPNLAKVTLARKIASTSLAMWKKEQRYDPTKRLSRSK